MFKNYLKIAVRSLRKQRMLSSINVLGLSVGLACFSLFMLYALNEFSFDRFHENADRIHRVYRWTEAMFGRDAQADASMPMPLGPAMLADLPDVEAFVRFRGPWGEELVRVNEEISRQQIVYADPNVFDLFSFPLKYGNPATALADPNNLVLTEDLAQSLFGVDNPVGQSIEIQIDDRFQPFTVSAVAKNIPSNSTVSFGILGSFEKLIQSAQGQRSVGEWRRSSFSTFVLLREGSTLASDADRLLNFRERYYPDTESQLRERGNWTGEGPPVTYRMQKLSEVHRDTQVRGGFVEPVNPRNTWMLLLIAAGILLIACINFTTLAIGRSARRAKEVGVRKVVGSSRGQLALQFFTEALLLSVVSASIGVLLAYIFLPAFNTLSGQTLSFSLSQYPELVWLFLGLTIVVSIIAGCYPSLVLSGFRPIEVLKSTIRVGGANFLTRSLVTIQFALAVGLMVSTIVILQQVQLMQNKNPGFDKEHVVMVDAGGVDTELVYPLFKAALSGRSEISGVSGAELSLGEGGGLSRHAWDYRGDQKSAYEYFVDEDYMDVMGLQLLAGRNFSDAFADDTVSSVIVNETFVREFGWTIDNAVGQVLEGYDEGFEPVVIGVLKDFHFQPFREEVKPQLFHQFSDYTPYSFFVRLHAGEPGRALAIVEDTWADLTPEVPFQYRFLDDSLDQFYRAEVRFGRIISWAGGLSIFLSCLGLFGLATLAAANRTKEVGIRKVLGASYASLVGLLSKDYLKLVGVAIAVAVPITLYLMQSWLSNFAFRISLSWWHVVLAGGTLIAVTFLTVAVQSIRAALADPVKSLRYE